MEGGWHLPGEIVMVGENQIHDSLKKLKPVLDMLTDCKKIFIPPHCGTFLQAVVKKPVIALTLKTLVTRHTCSKNTHASGQT
jgi:hypothetical protein